MGVHWKHVVRRVLNRTGYDIIRTHSPSNLHGLINRPIRTVLDIGARYGEFAQFARTQFPTAKIFCFEPIPESVDRLRQWAQTQGGMVEVVPVALGATNEPIQMFHHLDASNFSSVLSTTSLLKTVYPEADRRRTITVPMMTLDNVMKDFVLQDEILVKMDVQGYEDRVLIGGVSVFSRAHVCLVEVTLDDLYSEQVNFPALVNQMDHFGFQYKGNIKQEFAKDGHVIWIDALFAK